MEMEGKLDGIYFFLFAVKTGNIQVSWNPGG